MARNLGISYTDKEPYYFISYNSEDESVVSEYAVELDKCGIPMWYDNGIQVGTAWENEIAERIENCTAVIMFLSKNIFLKENSYVYKEFELATEYSQKKVYVMMLDQIKKPEVPVRFRAWWTDVTRLHCINTYEFNSPKDSVQQLIKSFTMKIVGKVEETDDSMKTRYDSFVCQDGSLYDGEIFDGKRHGKGKCKYANGDIYEGDFVDDRITGKGKLYNAVGIYEGDFLNGVFNGKGEYYFHNGNYYEGDFVDGKITGKGYYIWANNDYYEGDFVDGKRTGKGRYEWANEDVYEGDFVADKRHGKGKLIFANGVVQEGTYIDGRFFNGLVYGESGGVIAKYVNGKRKNIH